MKKGENMKKQFSTTCDQEVFDEFKNICGKYGVAMNTVIEGLMKDFIKSDYEITLTKNGVELKKI